MVSLICVGPSVQKMTHYFCSMGLFGPPILKNILSPVVRKRLLITYLWLITSAFILDSVSSTLILLRLLSFTARCKAENDRYVHISKPFM